MNSYFLFLAYIISNSELDIENIPLSTADVSVACSSNCSITKKEEYQAQQLEKLLRNPIDSKHYIVTKKSSSLIKSNVWKSFGFSSKLRPDDLGDDIIPGFVTCFECFKTLLFDSCTRYMRYRRKFQNNN